MNDKDLMPFGRFKGNELGTLPDWYLKWLKDALSKGAPNKRSLQDKYLLKYIECRMLPQ